MAYAIITGALHAAPEAKTAKSGREYVSAMVRVREGEGSQYWRVTAFAEATCAELLRLRAGDALSAQGRMEASIWKPENGGEPRLNLSLTAESVLALRGERKPKADGSGDGRDARSGS